MLADFKNHDALYMELVNPGDGDRPVEIDKLPAIVELEKKIGLLESKWGGAITDLERETKEMINLVSTAIPNVTGRSLIN